MEFIIVTSDFANQNNLTYKLGCNVFFSRQTSTGLTILSAYTTGIWTGGTYACATQSYIDFPDLFAETNFPIVDLDPQNDFPQPSPLNFGS